MQQNVRKEKSLTILCEKFLSFYPKHVYPEERILISLDQMAQLLEVERRRIYDIVNVLESVEVLSRYCKNQYLWHGFSQVPYTLSKLKTLALKSDFLVYTKALVAAQLDLHQDSKQANNVCFESNYNIASYQASKVNSADATTQTISISRDEKSLGIMSQKFLMLFLTSEDGLVSINFAARVLLGDTKSDTTELGRFKTKIRRLYDIANVLTTIGLIKKYHLNDISISKPAYQYIGPEVDVIRDADHVFNFMNSGNPLSNSKHSLFDHFKRNLDLECIIPKFDVNTGILTSKDNKCKKQNSNVSNSPSNNQYSNPSSKKIRYQPYTINGSYSSHQVALNQNMVQYNYDHQYSNLSLPISSNSMSNFPVTVLNQADYFTTQVNFANNTLNQPIYDYNYNFHSYNTSDQFNANNRIQYSNHSIQTQYSSITNEPEPVEVKIQIIDTEESKESILPSFSSFFN